MRTQDPGTQDHGTLTQDPRSLRTRPCDKGLQVLRHGTPAPRILDPRPCTPRFVISGPWTRNPKLLDLSACIHFYIFNFNFSNFWNCLMSKNLLACSIKHLFGFFYYFWETRIFIGLQNKTSKNRKSLTSKRDNAKYSFVYFSVIKITGFFSRVKAFLLKFSERLLIFV